MSYIYWLFYKTFKSYDIFIENILYFQDDILRSCDKSSLQFVACSNVAYS